MVSTAAKLPSCGISMERLGELVLRCNVIEAGAPVGFPDASVQTMVIVLGPSAGSSTVAQNDDPVTVAAIPPTRTPAAPPVRPVRVTAGAAITAPSAGSNPVRPQPAAAPAPMKKVCSTRD